MVKRNILLTSIYDTTSRETNEYYFFDRGNKILYCDGLIMAEAGAKYILSQIDIDEIIVIGNISACNKNELETKTKLNDFQSINKSKIHLLSEYGFFCYRVAEFLEELNFERLDLNDKIDPARSNELLDMYKSFFNRIQKEHDSIRLDRMFHYISQNEDILKSYNETFKDLTPIEKSWLKEMIFTQLSDNYKFNSIENNTDITSTFIPISNSDTRYSSLQNVKGIINAFNFKPNEETCIYMDIGGLAKSDSYTLLSLLTMLGNEPNSSIKVKEIITIQNTKDRFIRKIDNSSLDQYEISKLVSGINAFIKYGKIDMIEEYWKSKNIHNTHIENLLYAMKYVDDGISLCSIKDLEYGISLLKKVFNDTITDDLPELESNIFLALEKGISLDYGALLESDKVDTLELIKWSYRKGLYQQVFTIIESKVPEEFVNRGILYYAKDEDSKSKFLKSINEWFWFALPKDRYQFNDLSHYFIKYYGICLIYENRKNKSLSREDAYADFKLDRLTGGDDYATQSFSRLEHRKDLLKYLLSNYLKVSSVRNQISHAISSDNFYINEIDTKLKNQNIEMFKKTIESFIYSYEKVVNELNKLDDEYHVVKITNEELKAYTFAHKNEGLKAVGINGHLFKFRADPYLNLINDNQKTFVIDNGTLPSASIVTEENGEFKEISFRIKYEK